MTCLYFDNFFKCLDTFCAVSPDIPVSISSKIKVDTGFYPEKQF